MSGQSACILYGGNAKRGFCIWNVKLLRGQFRRRDGTVKVADTAANILVTYHGDVVPTRRKATPGEWRNRDKWFALHATNSIRVHGHGVDCPRRHVFMNLLVGIHGHPNRVLLCDCELMRKNITGCQRRADVG